MEKLGLLKDLKINEAFTFKGKHITYAVVSKNKNKVQYRRIERSCRTNAEKSFLKYDKLGNDKHFMCQIYEHNGNVEVYDFLPF